ncbi:MAG: helix-turn-helix transcriptional regulator [Planctomycetota bacterium]
MFRPEEFDRPRPEDFSAPYFFFSTHGDARVSYATASLSSVLGYDPVRILGQCSVNLLVRDHPLNADTELCYVSETTPIEPLNTLRAVRHRSGEPRILSIQSSVVIDRNGGPIRKHCIAQDVTDQWAMTLHVRERLDQLQSSLAALSDRERRIAEAAMKGRSNDAVAEDLAVSVRTIERTRKRLRQRFGVNHVAEIVTLVSECNTLERLWNLQAKEPWRNARNFAFDASKN